MTRYVYISHSALAHHGIKGMKWGKRNGPPYPLDPSDHSAAEKKATGGRYSQGVKQNRKKMTDEERAEKIRKIKKGLAIGAGVAGAAALTAGGVYALKHPETVKAALGGVKDLAISGARGLKSTIKVSKIKNEGFRNNAQAKINKSFANKFDSVSKNFREARRNDKAKLTNAKVNRVTNRIERKAARTERSNERKGILSGNILSDSNIEKMKDNARFITNNESKLRDAFKAKGQDPDTGVNDLYKAARLRESNRSYGSRKQGEYKSNTGIKGVAKKVWAPVAGAATVAGTVSSTVGRINGAINTVGSAMNNPYVKKAYNSYMNDPYYDQQQNQNKKKK